RAATMTQEGDEWRLENVRVYDVGAGGFRTALRAGAAIHDGAGWRLEGATAFDAANQRWVAAEPDAWRDGPPPATILAAALDPEQARVGGLARATEAVQGLRGAARLETALLHRFAAPAASLIMPLLAAIAGFGLHRSNTLLARIAAGLGL